ncbi:MAG TPA: hypothetical protein VFO27_03910 [Bryobacteraceae bacterium]|nr:hypothetical protein [Bryobacteraceae bacterium]
MNRKLLAAAEVVAILPATMILMPLMFYGAMGTVAALVGAVRAGGAVTFVPVLSLLAQMVVGCASLTCVWILLVSAKTVYRDPLLRRLAIVILVSGLVDATYFLAGQSELNRRVTYGTRDALIWMGMLGLPMLVGARHLYMLLASGHADGGRNCSTDNRADPRDPRL